MTLNVLAQSLGFAAIALAGALVAQRAAAATPADDRLRQDLRSVSRLRIFFGHQSVGANVLEGVAEVSAQAGVPLPIAEVTSAERLPQAELAHALVGQNGDPRSKLAAFDRALGAGAQVDVALVKLCYVDVDASTDVAALFADYRATIEKLRARHPRTRFVHVTVPLRADQGWLKTTVKQLLGRGPGVVADNARREAYNALLREAYRGQPIFDLARVESTRSDGRAETATLDGKPVPMLVPAYSDDAAHLNADGRRLAARALLAVLASLGSDA